MSEQDWARLDAEAQRVVEAALAFAQAGTAPNPGDALESVYAP